jgi:hypothetical protein
MPTRTLSCIVISAAALFPVQAQDGIRWLNFNIGGGLSVPLNPTARYAGLSGNGTTGAGINFDKHNSLEGDFLWVGLPPEFPAARQLFRPDVSVNLLALTGEYRVHVDDIRESPVGFYVLGGGGLYHRITTIEGRLFVPPQIACQPVYNWWEIACTPNGFVSSTRSGLSSSNAGGINGGAGFTFRFHHSGWKLFAEARYHYVWSDFVRTTFVPVTFGLRYH